MRVFCTLFRRELGSYFRSLTGFVVIAAILLLNGISLVDMITKANGLTFDMPVMEMFYNTAYFWIILLFSAPAITMRAFAAEKSSGTYESLMTTPVGDWQVVLAKFFGTWTFFLIAWTPLLAVLLTLRKVTGEEAWFVPKVIASSFLGIGLIGALYMAIGCFASSLTRSQIIAAMTSFLLGVSLWVLSLRTLLPNPDATLLDQFLGHLSLLRHMEDFVRGIVDARHLVFYITGILFFLFLTQRVVESRRWK